MTDALLVKFVGNLKQEIADKEKQMPCMAFKDLYDVGLVQGEVRGLQFALLLLERAIEEADI